MLRIPHCPDNRLTEGGEAVSRASSHSADRQIRGPTETRTKRQGTETIHCTRTERAGFRFKSVVLQFR
jgi:hypothetical protein